MLDWATILISVIVSVVACFLWFNILLNSYLKSFIEENNKHYEECFKKMEDTVQTVLKRNL